MKFHKRLIALVLLAGMLLGGCGFAKKQMAQAPDTIVPDPTTPSILPPQVALDDAALQTISERTELSMLAAAFAWDQFYYSFTDRYNDWMHRISHIGDIDNDGHLELIYSDSLLTFDLSTRATTRYHFLAGGQHDLYLASDQRVFMTYSSGGPEDVPHDEHYHFVHWTPYCAWDGSVWDSEFVVHEDYSFRDERFEECDQDLSYAEDMSTEDLAQKLEDLNLQPITSTAHDFLSYTYDAAYTDSILTALDTYFANSLSGYQGSFAINIDGDDHLEQLFVVSDFVSPWFPEVSEDSELMHGMDYAFLYDYPNINPSDNRTAIVIADAAADKLTLNTYCLPHRITVTDNSTITHISTKLMVDGTSYYTPGSAISPEACVGGLNTFLTENGYSSSIFLPADLSDNPADEFLCLSQRDDIWYLLVLQFRNGYASICASYDLDTNACFLTTVDGQDCLLMYSQKVWEYSDSFTTNYSLKLIRFDVSGAENILDEQYASYDNEQEDAQAISAFFDVFNKYIASAKAIRDPFSLTGQQWVDPEDVMFGEPPQEEEPETQQEQIGFVDINDPSSWLNLREGPGLEYDCIRIDPDDPESIVKQAKGSPVTVLETIETDDEEHPVWLKVRIRYLDRELIGYSSKTYIRLAGE